jgi:hypothetical protein
LSQPDANPYALANLLAPALDGIVHALSDRGGQSQAQYQAKAGGFRTLILSFQPNDVVDMQLAGQTVLFNEVLAHSARDVLRGMDDAVKPRVIASLVSMGRLAQGHLDRLAKRGNTPHRTEAVSVEQEKIRTSLALARAAGSVEEPCPLAAMPLCAEPETDAGDTGESPPGPPAEETSWLDEPFVQWLVETPADLARKSGLVAVSEAEAPAGTVDRDDGTGTRSSTAEASPEPALPFQPDGYAPARTMPTRTSPIRQTPTRTLPARQMPAQQMPDRQMMNADTSAGD